MLTVKVISYDESNDAYYCDIVDSLTDSNYSADIPACLIPYIASAECNECNDLPFDMVNKTFTLNCPIETK